jgi:multiple sugar transport system permease protein
LQSGRTCVWGAAAISFMALDIMRSLSPSQGGVPPQLEPPGPLPVPSTARRGAAALPSRTISAVRALTDRRFFLLAAIPAVLLLTAVTLVPILFGIWLSFTNYQPLNPSLNWAGLGNYSGIVSGPNAYFTHVAIENTLVFVGGALALETCLGVLLALILARDMRGIAIFRTIFVIPLMVAGVASAVSGRSLLNTGNGWINYFLGTVGFPQPNWLGSAHTAMLSIILVDAWGGVPIIAIIVLAGLLLLPKEPFDAARIDGASEFEIFWHIKLPGIRTVLAFAVMFRIIDLFRQFAEFQVITGGGPGLSTNVLNFYVYQQTFFDGNLGFGAALAILLVLLMAIPLILMFRIARRR